LKHIYSVHYQTIQIYTSTHDVLDGETCSICLY